MATVTDEKPLTGVRKRQQIADANKQMLIWVGVAAVIVSVCAVLVLNFVQRIVYQAKVNGKISDTAKVMTKNVESIDDLITEVNKLSTNTNLNLSNLRSSDSTAFQVVLDALPTEDDRTALGASLQQKVLAPSGVSIEQLSVTKATSKSSKAATTDTTTSNSNKPTAQPIIFNMAIEGNYNAIQQAIRDIERTIRPFVINTMDLQGTDDQLKATISATTYYVPSVDYALGSEEVEP